MDRRKFLIRVGAGAVAGLVLPDMPGRIVPADEFRQGIAEITPIAPMVRIELRHRGSEVRGAGYVAGGKRFPARIGGDGIYLLEGPRWEDVTLEFDSARAHDDEGWIVAWVEEIKKAIGINIRESFCGPGRDYWDIPMGHGTISVYNGNIDINFRDDRILKLS